MTTLRFLKDQVIETRSFTKRLIAEMPEDLWYEIPENTDSNFAWQIGHIFLAQNYHIISCSFGIEPRITEKIPLRTYSKALAGLGSVHRSINKDFASPSKLIENLDFVFDLSVQ